RNDGNVQVILNPSVTPFGLNVAELKRNNLRPEVRFVASLKATLAQIYREPAMRTAIAKRRQSSWYKYGLLLIINF
ncbi:MAG TPA: hypothetical protein PLC40_15960, partial [Candidatus Hydrogenedentes bacterium]|nr:hypothetical protein [Candidatus Hydrogenedentota bacterium]